MRKIENYKAIFLENLIKVSFVCYIFSHLKSLLKFKSI